jgi:hypothetical protein
MRENQRNGLGLGLGLGLALALLTARVWHLARRDLLLDDAFITFRYARNLAHGLGLVFNPGERVEGYTTFLWTVLLAGAARLGLDIPTASVGLAFLATVGTLLLLFALGRRLFRDEWQALIAPLVFAGMGAHARYVVSGMETALFVFLVTLGLYLYVRQVPPVWTGLVFGLSALTRPEAVLYLGVVVLFHLLWSPSPAGFKDRLAGGYRIAAGFAVLYAPYFLWRYNYYGFLLPNTFYLKAGGGGPLLWQRGWLLLEETLREASLELPLALAVLGAVAGRPRRLRLLWGLVVGVTLLYFVAVGGDFLLFFGPRFLLPAVPSLLLLAVSAWSWVEERSTTKTARLALRTAFLLALMVNAVWFSWPARFDTIDDWAAIDRGWLELGRWLAANTPADAVIAVGAAGYIPYSSERFTIDMLGKSDLHIAHLPVALGPGIPGHEKYDLGYVLGRRPDYLVFARLDRKGVPRFGEWETYRERVEADYRMIALARSGRPGDGLPWVIEAAEFTPELGEKGYLASIYRRRAPGG